MVSPLTVARAFSGLVLVALAVAVWFTGRGGDPPTTPPPRI